MNYLKSKMEVMNLLGCGYSVASLINKLGLTYNELCDLYAEYPDLARELNRWYPLYDFRCKKEEPAKTDAEVKNGDFNSCPDISVEDVKKAEEQLNNTGYENPVLVEEGPAENTVVERIREELKEMPVEEVKKKPVAVKKKATRKKKVQ